MKYCQFKRTFAIILFLLVGFVDFESLPSLILTKSNAEDSPALPAADIPKRGSFWDRIETDFGGRFKLTGTASRATADTLFEPVGTGTYYDSTADFRLTNETFFTDMLLAEIHYQVTGVAGDTLRKTNELEEFLPNLSGDLRGVLLPGAPLDDGPRLMDLTDTIVDEDSYFLVQRLDRLYVALTPQWGSVRIGRQAITWGNGFVFNPFDLFNPFPPTAIDRDYKVGDDMINAQLSIPRIGDLQGLYVVRRNPDTNNVESDQNSLAGKLHFAAGTTEFDIMGAQHFEDYVTGIGSTGYLGEAAWRINGTWTFLDDGDNYLSLNANMDYSWVWFNKNFYGFIEYYHNGLGEDDYPQALLNPNVTKRLARGELFVLGQNYLSTHIEVELHPLFKVYFTSINNVEDPSGILQPYATWDITQNLQMTGGGSVSYGSSGTEFGGFKLHGTDIRTKSPDNVYLWLSYYF